MELSVESSVLLVTVAGAAGRLVAAFSRYSEKPE
jgi:hypothetical protein